MKQPKSLVSLLMTVFLLCSIQSLKTNTLPADTSCNTLIDSDIHFGKELLQSHFIKNIHRYALPNDSCKKLIQMLWQIDTQTLIPIKTGPFAAITPKIFETLLTYIYTDIHNIDIEKTLIEKLTEADGWIKQYKKQIPHTTAFLESKLKKINTKLEILYARKTIVYNLYMITTKEKIDNNKYKKYQWHLQQEKNHIKKRLQRKARTNHNQLDKEQPHTQEYLASKAHLIAKTKRIFAIESNYIHYIDQQHNNRQTMLISIQKEQQILEKIKKDITEKIQIYRYHNNDQYIKEYIAQHIKHFLTITRQALVNEQTSGAYLPRTTYAILWAFSGSLFDTIQEIKQCLQQTKQVHNATYCKQVPIRDMKTISNGISYLFYNSLEIDNEISKVKTIKQLIKQKKVKNTRYIAFITTLAYEISTNDLIRKICKYIFVHEAYKHTPLMKYIIRHPHQALLEAHNIKNVADMKTICQMFAYTNHINKKDSQGNTPLIHAITHQNTQLIIQLLYAGANPEITKNDKTALMEYIATLMQAKTILNSDQKKAITLLIQRSDLTVGKNNFYDIKQFSEQQKNIYAHKTSEYIHNYLAETIIEKKQYQYALQMKITEIEYTILSHTQKIKKLQENKIKLITKIKKKENEKNHWSTIEKRNKQTEKNIKTLKVKIRKAQQVIKKYPQKSARLIQQTIKSLEQLKTYEILYAKTEEQILAYKNSIIDKKTKIAFIDSIIKELIRKITTLERSKEDIVDELF